LLTLPDLSYQFELGMNIYTLSINHNPFDLLLALTGTKYLTYAIPYVLVLKNITAGLFFYAYLKKLKLGDSAAIICAVSFSFCGYMIVNGHWYHYQNYAVFIAVVLLCFERWYQDGRWLAFVLVFGFLNMKGELQLAQVAVFFMIYIPFRCMLDGHPVVFPIVKNYVFFAILFIVGVGISAFYLLPNADIIWQSARGGNSAGKMAQLSLLHQVFSFSKIEDWWTILFRYLSSDILGSFQLYKGEGSYLEDPAAYIGLASLAVIPGVFWIRPLHKKIAVFGLLTVCFLYFLFPIIRTAGNLFASPTYKYTILYISVFILIIVGLSLDNYFKSPVIVKQFAISVFLFVLFILVGINILSTVSGVKRMVDPGILKTVNIFLCIYLLLLPAYAFGRYRWGRILIAGVMIFEIALFAKITTNRVTGNLTPQFITEGNCYFNNDTNAAIAYLKIKDTDFYRIAKDNHACTLNDALIQGYNGTTGYHGFASKDLISFYKVLGLSNNSRRLVSYRFGFERSPYLLSLFNVKYYIADDLVDFPKGFKLIKRFGNRYLYENKNHLPLGTAYQHQLQRKQFKKKSYSERRALLLKGFVGEYGQPRLEKLTTLDTHQVKRIHSARSEIVDWFTNIETQNLQLLSSDRKDEFHYIVKNGDPKIILSSEKTTYFSDLKITLDIQSDHDTNGQLFWESDAFSQSNSRHFRVTKGRHTYKLSVGKVAIRSLRVDVGEKSGQKIDIHKIRFFTHRISGVNFEETITQLRSDSLMLEQFSGDYLKGTIQTDTDKLLFFSIPYDYGWSARLNGKIDH